jgi:hypothetical protein
MTDKKVFVPVVLPCRHCGVQFSSDKEREELAGLEPENQLATFTGTLTSHQLGRDATRLLSFIQKPFAFSLGGAPGEFYALPDLFNF